jgi:dolichol-phosphate mannosyltransferase
MIPPAAHDAPLLSVVVPCYNEAANVAPLVDRLHHALAGLAWEVIFVDDDSPDGTAATVRALARTDAHLRCLRRIGRRGLASAVIEGAMAASGTVIAVMDGDLQHDETRLPAMLAALRAGNDIVVGSRYVEGGDSAGLADRGRERLSTLGTALARRVLPVQLADPMSGFFMLNRALFDTLAPKLTGYGFKILLDLLLAAPPGLRVAEVPFKFGERLAGDSKLDALVLVQFGGLLFDRMMGGLVPPRFVAFAAVGLLGLGVHLLALLAGRAAGLGFDWAQGVATVAAMVFNFHLNNRLTYRTQRLRGPRLWRGLALFMLVCGLGAIANINVASLLYADHASWGLAGAAGALIGLVWNYAVSATLVWRPR